MDTQAQLKTIERLLGDDLTEGTIIMPPNCLVEYIYKNGNWEINERLEDYDSQKQYPWPKCSRLRFTRKQERFWKEI